MSGRLSNVQRALVALLGTFVPIAPGMISGCGSNTPPATASAPDAGISWVNVITAGGGDGKTIPPAGPGAKPSSGDNTSGSSGASGSSGTSESGAASGSSGAGIWILLRLRDPVGIRACFGNEQRLRGSAGRRIVRRGFRWRRLRRLPGHQLRNPALRPPGKHVLRDPLVRNSLPAGSERGVQRERGDPSLFEQLRMRRRHGLLRRLEHHRRLHPVGLSVGAGRGPVHAVSGYDDDGVRPVLQGRLAVQERPGLHPPDVQVHGHHRGLRHVRASARLHVATVGGPPSERTCRTAAACPGAMTGHTPPMVG